MIIVNTKHTPEVSIIIPTYKRPAILKRALKSVLNQSYTNFELIVINDDLHCDNRLRFLIKDLGDSRIKYYRNNRTKGANGARNTGILKSKGNYICFLDDDDEWFPEKIEIQLQKLQSLELDKWGAVYCNRIILNNRKWISAGELFEGNLQFKILTQKISLNAGSTLMISKTALDDVGLFDEELVRHQELEFLLRFFEKYKIGVVTQELAKIYGHNIPSGRKYEKAKLIYLKKINKFINKQKLSDQKHIFAIHYRTLANIFAKERDIKKAIFYINKSISSRLLYPKEYVVFFLYLIKIIFTS